MPTHILPHALKLPAIEKLSGKRIVLASNSPRRQEILRTFVRGSGTHT
jgi:septum formation protein